MKTRRFLFVLAVLVLALPAAALAGPPQFGFEGHTGIGAGYVVGPFWDDDDVAAKLELNDDQIDALEGLDPAISLYEEMKAQDKKLCKELKGALEAGDAQAARLAGKRVAAFRTQMFKDYVDYNIAVRLILTPDQWEDLIDMQPVSYEEESTEMVRPLLK